MSCPVKVEVRFDNKEMDEEVKPSIEATFYRLFQVGSLRYAAFRKDDQSVCLLKIVEVNGAEELHDIESQAEFDSVLEFFLSLDPMK